MYVFLVGTYRHDSPSHRAQFNPRMTSGSLYYESYMQLNDTKPLRAKRRLDMDDIYSTTVKRAKSGNERETLLDNAQNTNKPHRIKAQLCIHLKKNEQLIAIVLHIIKCGTEIGFVKYEI